MDDVGNIIYVVVTIVAIVFSIIKKANASDKKATPSQNNQDEKTMPSFEDFFNPQKEELVTEPNITVKKVESGQDAFRAKMKEMDQKLVRIKKKDDTNSVYKITDDKGSKKGANWFNAKDAIIYSEIMKRPEF